MIMGSPGTWETFRLHRNAGWSPGLPTPVHPRPRPEPVGTNGTKRVIAKRRKRSAARGPQGVAAPHSSVEAGERPSRTPWSEGGAALWTRSWNHAEDTEPHQRVTASQWTV